MSRRIVIPRGIVNPNETTIIDIPAELAGESDLIASPSQCEGSMSNPCATPSPRLGRTQNLSSRLDQSLPVAPALNATRTVCPGINANQTVFPDSPSFTPPYTSTPNWRIMTPEGYDPAQTYTLGSSWFDSSERMRRMFGSEGSMSRSSDGSPYPGNATYSVCPGNRTQTMSHTSSFDPDYTSTQYRSLRTPEGYNPAQTYTLGSSRFDSSNVESSYGSPYPESPIRSRLDTTQTVRPGGNVTRTICPGANITRPISPAGNVTRTMHSSPPSFDPVYTSTPNQTFSEETNWSPQPSYRSRSLSPCSIPRRDSPRTPNPVIPPTESVTRTVTNITRTITRPPPSATPNRRMHTPEGHDSNEESSWSPQQLSRNRTHIIPWEDSSRTPSPGVPPTGSTTRTVTNITRTIMRPPFATLSPCQTQSTGSLYSNVSLPPSSNEVYSDSIMSSKSRSTSRSSPSTGRSLGILGSAYLSSSLNEDSFAPTAYGTRMGRDSTYLSSSLNESNFAPTANSTRIGRDSANLNSSLHEGNFTPTARSTPLNKTATKTPKIIKRVNRTVTETPPACDGTRTRTIQEVSSVEQVLDQEEANQSIVDEMHNELDEIESAERTQMEEDLVTYQQARRALMANTTFTFGERSTNVGNTTPNATPGKQCQSRHPSPSCK